MIVAFWSSAKVGLFWVFAVPNGAFSILHCRRMHLSKATWPLGSHLLPSYQRCEEQKHWRSARVWLAGAARLGDRRAATRRGDRRTGDPCAGARQAATRRRGTAPGATARAPRWGRPRALGRPRTSAGARGGLPYPPEQAHIVHYLGALPWNGSFARFKKIAFLAVRLCRHSGSGFLPQKSADCSGRGLCVTVVPHV